MSKGTYEERMIAQLDKDCPRWYLAMASEQHLHDYVGARNDEARAWAVENMKSSAFIMCHYAVNAAIAIGAVKETE